MGEMTIKKILKANKSWLEPLFRKLQIASLKSAAKEQDLVDFSQKLAKIVPDLTSQYTTFNVDNEYLHSKVRFQHTFQIKMVLKAINKFSFSSQSTFTVVDIGDSSGTHLMYLEDILKDDRRFVPKAINTVSVNLDPVAVDKISSKGLDAKLCRAEELSEKFEIKADLLVSFQMLEHLYDPIAFLDSMSRNQVSDYFVVTVPYLAQSRVGLDHIRQGQIRDVFPENTHIFELSPEDWKLIFQHSGWRVTDEMIYRQYPRRSLLKLMKPFWKNYDFEGFYGVILERDTTWAQCYKC